MRRLVCWLVLVAVASACAPPRASELLVGAVYPVDGGQGPGGLDEYRGVLLAAERANADAGSTPIRVELEPAASADAAPAAVERLVDAGAPVVVGSYGSTISRPAAEAADRLGAVFWETGAVGELGMSGSPGETFFRFPPSGRVLGREAVAFVREQVAPRLGRDEPLRYAVTYVDDDYGRSVALGAFDEIERSGGVLATRIGYDLASVDFDALARGVAAADADVLVVSAYLDDGVEIRRAIVRNDVHLLATIGTSSSYCMPEFGAILGDDAVGVFASDKPDADVVAEEALLPDGADLLRWARDTYRRRYDETMSAAALSGFSAAWALFAHVLPSAGGQPTATSIARAALRARVPSGGLPNGAGLEIAGPGHPSAGANLRATSVVWEWVGRNERAIVWPPAFATREIVVPT